MSPSTEASVTSGPLLRPRRRASRQARHEALTGWAFALPFVLLFCLVFLTPIVSSIWEAFFQEKASGGGPYGGGELVHTFVGLENYLTAAANPAFWTGMGRVVVFGLFQIPVMILAALFLALLLDSYLVRRPGTWRLLYFLPFAIPGLIAAIMWGVPVHPRGLALRRCAASGRGPALLPVATGDPGVHGQHDHLDVHRLQHADLPGGAAGHPR